MSPSVAEAGVEPAHVLRADWGARVELVDPDGYRIHLSRSA